jgi:predicted  nucleic acid-binding Zn-ribbon protein
MAHIEDGITAAHEQAEAIGHTLSAQGERVAALEQTDTDHGSAIESLEVRATALEKDAEATMSTLETVQDTVTAHGATLETIQQRVVAVERENTEQTQAISDLSAIASANSESITQVQQTVNENAGAVSTLNDTVNRQDEEISDLQDASASLSETLNSTRENVQTLNESVARLDSEVAAIPDVIGEIRTHNESPYSHADIRTSVNDVLVAARAYTDAEIAAIPTPDVSGQIQAHNTNTDAHADIRAAVEAALTEAKEYTDETKLEVPFSYEYMPDGYPRDQVSETLVEGTFTKKADSAIDLGKIGLEVGAYYMYEVDGQRYYGKAVVIGQYWDGADRIAAGDTDGRYLESDGQYLWLNREDELGEHTVTVALCTVAEQLNERFIPEDSKGIASKVAAGVAEAKAYTDAEIAKVSTGGGSVPKPLTYDYMPEGYPKKEVVDVITWDGNTEGLVNVSGVIFKVSDVVLTRADIIKARLKITSISDGTVKEVEVGDENIFDCGDVFAVTDAVMVAQKDNITFSGLTFPEAGVYFMCSPGNQYVSEFSGFETTTVASISYEFMPKGYGYIKEETGVLVSAEGEALSTAMMSPLGLAAGETYTVEVNGVAYTGTAAAIKFQGFPVVAMGDVYTMSGGQIGTAPTGDPYVLIDFGAPLMEGMYWALEMLDSSDISLLSISGTKKEVITMSPDFLPEGYAKFSRKESEVLPETTFSDWDINGENDGVIGEAILLPNKKYLVEFDGTCYEFTSSSIDLGGGGVLLGDTNLTRPETYGFTILQLSQTAPALYAYVLDGNSPHTFRIVMVDETLQTMSEKLLPMQSIVDAVLDALSTWNGGSY